MVESYFFVKVKSFVLIVLVVVFINPFNTIQPILGQLR